MSNRGVTYCLVLALMIVVLFALNILVGAVNIPADNVVRILFTDAPDVKPSWRYIILESRLPQALTAVLTGGALAVSGLMLQTAFRNPLAGPSIFGSSAASSARYLTFCTSCSRSILIAASARSRMIDSTSRPT